MSKWFPDVSEAEGLEDARKAGFFGACAFAAMIVLGIAIVFFADATPVLGQPVPDPTAAVIGMLAELALAVVAAWRLKIGKGAFWGSALALLFVAEIIGKIAGGTTNVGWMIAYAAIFIALVNGVRGAWARRGHSDAEAFE